MHSISSRQLHHRDKQASDLAAHLAPSESTLHKCVTIPKLIYSFSLSLLIILSNKSFCSFIYWLLKLIKINTTLLPLPFSLCTSMLVVTESARCCKTKIVLNNQDINIWWMHSSWYWRAGHLRSRQVALEGCWLGNHRRDESKSRPSLGNAWAARLN